MCIRDSSRTHWQVILIHEIQNGAENRSLRNTSSDAAKSRARYIDTLKVCSCPTGYVDKCLLVDLNLLRFWVRMLFPYPTGRESAISLFMWVTLDLQDSRLPALCSTQGLFFKHKRLYIKSHFNFRIV